MQASKQSKGKPKACASMKTICDRDERTIYEGLSIDQPRQAYRNDETDPPASRL